MLVPRLRMVLTICRAAQTAPCLRKYRQNSLLASVQYPRWSDIPWVPSKCLCYLWNSVACHSTSSSFHDCDWISDNDHTKGCRFFCCCLYLHGDCHFYGLPGNISIVSNNRSFYPTKHHMFTCLLSPHLCEDFFDNWKWLYSKKSTTNLIQFLVEPC